MTRDFFYDTEFIDNGKTIELISIGMVDLNGGEFYAENIDVPMERICENPWLAANVAPHLSKDPEALKTRDEIAKDVVEFITSRLEPGSDRSNVRLWGYYSAYDHVALAQLFGRMIDLPDVIPMFTHDLQQVCSMHHIDPHGMFDISQQDEHNALADARWNRDLFEHLNRDLLEHLSWMGAA